MKKYFLGVAMLALLIGCNTKEREALQHRVDSLSFQLKTSQELDAKLEMERDEVGALIDSIDANRQAVKVRMTEGGSYSEYITRLKDINKYVLQTQAKLNALEKSSKNSSSVSSASIRRLRADLEKREQEVLDLQLQITKVRDENLALWKKSNEKDSVLANRDQVIKINEGDIGSLQKLVNDTQAENKLAVANLYFDQAAALELAADRTNFAPRKRRAAREDALELYKLSLDLGNTKAEKRINDLEKKLS